MHSYVCHDWFVCVTWRIRWELAESVANLLSWVMHHTFGACLIYVRCIRHSCVWRTDSRSFSPPCSTMSARKAKQICLVWVMFHCGVCLTYVCGNTHSYVCRTHSHALLDSYHRREWSKRVCVVMTHTHTHTHTMTHTHTCTYIQIRVHQRTHAHTHVRTRARCRQLCVATEQLHCSVICVTWLIHMWWRIHMCDVTRLRPNSEADVALHVLCVRVRDACGVWKIIICAHVVLFAQMRHSSPRI